MHGDGEDVLFSDNLKLLCGPYAKLDFNFEGLFYI